MVVNKMAFKQPKYISPRKKDVIYKKINGKRVIRSFKERKGKHGYMDLIISVDKKGNEKLNYVDFNK